MQPTLETPTPRAARARSTTPAARAAKTTARAQTTSPAGGTGTAETLAVAQESPPTRTTPLDLTSRGAEDRLETATSQGRNAKLTTVEIKTTDMYCPSCPMLIELTLRDLPGVDDVTASTADSLTVVVFDETRVTLDAILIEIRKSGSGAECAA
jgi:copper chaperone CopZ